VDLCLKCYSKERSLLKTLTAAATGQTNEWYIVKSAGLGKRAGRNTDREKIGIL
jgi:hypothetical protein